MLKTMIETGLTQNEYDLSVRLLNGLLADHFTLMLQTWGLHWNVTGNSFGSYHQALENLYEREIERVDSVAERVRSLGGAPLVTMQEMLANAHITITPHQPSSTTFEMWSVVKAQWETVIRTIRDIHTAIPQNDLATLNFLEDMIDKMEKDAWMIRSYTSSEQTTNND